MDHEQLMLITRCMPMKTIEINGEPYLERYFVGVDEHGHQDWLHRFLRSDSERHLHSHPWDADSTILCGAYSEERLRGEDKIVSEYFEGDQNIIGKEKLHRIIAVEPNTWTHMRVYAGREPFWYFIGDDGVKKEMRSSEPDWYENCQRRP